MVKFNLQDPYDQSRAPDRCLSQGWEHRYLHRARVPGVVTAMLVVEDVPSGGWRICYVKLPIYPFNIK